MKKKSFYIMSILVVITILLMSLIIRKDVELTLWTDNSNKKEIINYVKDYLNSLQPGTYTLFLEYNDGGMADATFTIKDRGSQSINNPKTGDGMTTFVVMLGLSVIGFAATKKYLKNM